MSAKIEKKSIFSINTFFSQSIEFEFNMRKEKEIKIRIKKKQSFDIFLFLFLIQNAGQRFICHFSSFFGQKSETSGTGEESEQGDFGGDDWR